MKPTKALAVITLRPTIIATSDLYSDWSASWRLDTPSVNSARIHRSAETRYIHVWSEYARYLSKKYPVQSTCKRQLKHKRTCTVLAITKCLVTLVITIVAMHHTKSAWPNVQCMCMHSSTEMGKWEYHLLCCTTHVLHYHHVYNVYKYIHTHTHKPTWASLIRTFHDSQSYGLVLIFSSAFLPWSVSDHGPPASPTSTIAAWPTFPQYCHWRNATQIHQLIYMSTYTLQHIHTHTCTVLSQITTHPELIFYNLCVG